MPIGNVDWHRTLSNCCKRRPAHCQARRPSDSTSSRISMPRFRSGCRFAQPASQWTDALRELPRVYIAPASYRIRVCSPANSLNKIDYERTISEQFRARERRQSATAQHLNVCALKRAYAWGCRSLPIYWSPRNELNFITAISLMNEFQQFAKCLRECLSTWTRRIPLPHRNVKESVWLSSSALLFLPSVILCSCSRNNA